MSIGVRPVHAQQDNPNPPEEPVKLVFIHHSTGENLLRDDYGTLGRTLDANNYFVSDTNYGWGPGAIGDRTDIVNWPEWFGVERSDEVLNALYNQSGQNSSYTRTLSDPGGENEIILFKSCFPNSNLEGSPTDPPTAGEYSYSVGSAKFIYNSLLDYFSSRPDKMFVVLTAPPVTDSSYAANARAFNNWLVTEWLADYSTGNVFVFDFYNILTSPNNHHRFMDGSIQYINDQGGNTSYYPSEDDHPNIAGSQKAVEEFVPLLNVFYQRWKSRQPLQTVAPATQEEPAAGVTQPPVPENIVTDFENDTGSLVAYRDENGSTIDCQVDTSRALSGNSSLKIDYSVIPGGWVDCIHAFAGVQDWSTSAGISFSIYSDKPIQNLVLRADVGDPNLGTAPFETLLEIPSSAANDWTYIYAPWSDFLRASWADPNTGPQEFDLAHIADLDFNLSGGEETVENTIWIDDVRVGNLQLDETPMAVIEAATPFQSSETQPAEVESTNVQTQSATPGTQNQGGFLHQVCPLSPALPMAIVIFTLHRRKKNPEGANQRLEFRDE